MSQTNICLGITAAQNAPGVSQTGPAPSNIPPGSQAADYHLTGAGLPVAAPGNATWHVVLTSSSGSGVAVSCTFNPLVSNDGINWTGGGIAPIILASGPAPQSGVATTVQNFAYYSGYFSVISGTGATGKCVLNA